MTHWIDFKHRRLKAARYWMDEETQLLMEGKPVTHRSATACEARRRSLGRKSDRNRFVKAVYEPPKPVPEELRWPK